MKYEKEYLPSLPQTTIMTYTGKEQSIEELHDYINSMPTSRDKRILTNLVKNLKAASNTKVGLQWVKAIAWEAWKRVYIINTDTGHDIEDVNDTGLKGHDWTIIYDGEFTSWWNLVGSKMEHTADTGNPATETESSTANEGDAGYK